MPVTDPKNSSGSYASSPCYAAEFEQPLDAQQQRDVNNWRSAERKRQRERRRALTPEQQDSYAQAVAAHLDSLLEKKYGDIAGKVVGGYWPIQGELDLVFWFHKLCKRGVRVALPITIEQDAPLIFREWLPETNMEKDRWHIPIPPVENAQLLPEILLSPLLAWDVAGYRLGYGGGYFDRTLAALSPKPFVIGVGIQVAQVPTIFPQTYDIPMDAVVTEIGVHSPSQ